MKHGRIPTSAWRKLEMEPARYGTLNARWLSHGAVALAVDHQYRHHLLLPIGREEDGFTDRRSRGLIVVTRLLEIEGSTAGWVLDLCCTDRSVGETFDLVGNALLEELESGVMPTVGVQRTLARWRRFWGVVPFEGLSDEEVIGLFGELWFLLVWLLPHGGHLVANWLGPEGARSDFQWPAAGVEVKTTRSTRGHLHRVNGLDQLEVPEQGRLDLFSLRIREELASENSLIQLITRITELLAGTPEALDLFERRLIATGYSPGHDERYKEMRFRVVDERLYSVKADFPRLSIASFAGGLPSGIERVEYEINLEGFPHLIAATSSEDFTPPLHGFPSVR